MNHMNTSLLGEERRGGEETHGSQDEEDEEEDGRVDSSHLKG